MNEKLSEEDVDWLVANNKIVIQFGTAGNRVSVGLPFAMESSGDQWWMCCPQGKFRLLTDAPALFPRGNQADSQHWVSICEYYRSFLACRHHVDLPLNLPVPNSVANRDSEWLLDFVRHCTLVVVSNAQDLPLMPPETRAMVPSKPGVALTKIKSLVRRRGSRRFQPRR